MKSDRDTFVKGSDTPCGRSLHDMAGDTWRARARRPIRNVYNRWCVENSRPKKLYIYAMAKLTLLLRLGEDRRTLGATCRPLDHGSTCCIGGRHKHHLVLPETTRVGRGLILCRVRRSVVA